MAYKSKENLPRDKSRRTEGTELVAKDFKSNYNKYYENNMKIDDTKKNPNTKTKWNSRDGKHGILSKKFTR